MIPSGAGYGFSDKPTATGWNPERMARAWTVLMKRLGYQRFVAQGGDWGAFVTNELGRQAPPELIGIHVNFVGAMPSDVIKALQSGGPAPTDLSAEEKRAYDQLAFAFQNLPTQIMMIAHPQTLYGLADSPVALAAWMIARACCTGGNRSATAVPRGRYTHVFPIGDGQSGDIADEAENGCQGPFLVEGKNQRADNDNQCQSNGNGTA